MSKWSTCANVDWHARAIRCSAWFPPLGTTAGFDGANLNGQNCHWPQHKLENARLEPRDVRRSKEAKLSACSLPNCTPPPATLLQLFHFFEIFHIPPKMQCSADGAYGSRVEKIGEDVPHETVTFHDVCPQSHRRCHWRRTASGARGWRS